MKRFGWLVCLAIWACGGGGGGGTDPGGDADVPRDVAPDQTPADLPPDVPVDTGRDLATDLPGEGTDTGSCLCEVEGPCCDGCQPVREGEPCGGEAPCTVPGTCRSGVCQGEGPATCPPPDDCHQGEGRCNPENGTCEYDPVADGAPCAALPETPWSGWCFGGACLGFGECDHRTYGQPFGSACNFPGDCASGICRSWGDGWTAFCSLPCGRDRPDCPDGAICYRYSDGAFCRPARQQDTLPGDASGVLFQACNRDEDCAGDLCLGIQGKRFCADPCDDGQGAAVPEKCGVCGNCRTNGDELGFKHKFYCVPQGVMEFGQPCGFSGECATRFCQNGLCSGECFSLGEGLSTCPENMECVAGVLAADPSIYLCVPRQDANKGFFEACVADWSCLDSRKCLTVAGESRCTTPCSEEAPCEVGACVQDDGSGSFLCVPEDQVGSRGQGEACTATWQCPEGVYCYQQVCLAPCPEDGDCGEPGICLPDAFFRVEYCTVPCGEDDGCPSGLVCFQGNCVLSSQGSSYLLGACRTDADCETGLCRQGICTEACSEELPCEGSRPIAEQPDGLCRPCDPALMDSDCNDGGWGFNVCVTGSDGASFCATDCSFLQNTCPLGTRCYSIGFQSVCAPLAFNCSDSIVCTAQGTCARLLADGALCREDAACRSGVCVDGVCGNPDQCVEDGDCKCQWKACVGGVCRLADGLSRESEPNDLLPESLSEETGIRIAALYPEGDLPDRDRYSLSLRAGDVLDVFTSDLCGAEGDTLIRLLQGDGTPIPGWENDDISIFDWFSALWGYQAETNQEVVIEVVQSPYVAGYARFPYVLRWRVYQAAENDACASAAPLGAEPVQGLLGLGTNRASAPGCTGTPGEGRDLFWKVVVGAGEALHVRLDSQEDLMVYLVQDCQTPAESCLAGADLVKGAGIEEVTWWNQGIDPVVVTVVVDASDMSLIGPFSLLGEVFVPALPDNDEPEGALDLLSGIPIEGTLLGAGNSVDPGAEGCSGVSLPGADVFYRVSLPAGTFLTVEVTEALGGMPYLWLSADPRDPSSCVAAGQGFVSFLAEQETVLILAVDSPDPGMVPSFRLFGMIGPPNACFGPCDPNTAVPVCHDEDSRLLCTCDAARGVWKPTSCVTRCRGSGALLGVCHSFTTPGYEKVDCLCEWTCDPETTAFHCDQLFYTNCSCGADDPCGWVGDMSCDAFCSIEYPGGFQDTADCSQP